MDESSRRKKLEKKVRRLEKQMCELKAQMKKAAIVSRVLAIEELLGV